MPKPKRRVGAANDVWRTESRTATAVTLATTQTSARSPAQGRFFYDTATVVKVSLAVDRSGKITHWPCRS
jgi:hypothetical protein